MKQTIEQWLAENTKYSAANIGKSLTLDFLSFDLNKLGINDANTKEEAIARIASQLAAHIENSKGGH